MPKTTNNFIKKKNFIFAQRTTKLVVKGRSPLQELEEVPRNRPYLLVTFKGFAKEPSSLCYKNLADKNSNQFKNIVGPA